MNVYSFLPRKIMSTQLLSMFVQETGPGTWDIRSQYLDNVVWFGAIVRCRGNRVLTVQSNVCV